MVPRKNPGPVAGIDDLRQTGLLDGQKRAHFISAGADHADRRRQAKHPEISAQGEDPAPGDHQDEPEPQHSAPAPTVGVRAQPKGDGRIAEVGECNQPADLHGGESQAVQVQNENDCDKSISEQPQCPGAKEQPQTPGRSGNRFVSHG
jgi:hypothetical protein